jgi:metal-responsive CopG/Arc/MetJ family transcriptional regulator
MSEQLTIPGIKPRRADAIHADRAAKQAAYRTRNNLKPVTIQLPMDLCERLGAHLVKTGKGKSETIADLIEKQLLRKR